MSDKSTNTAPAPGNDEVDPYEGKPRDYMGFIEVDNLDDEDLTAITGGDEKKDDSNAEPPNVEYPAEQWKEWGSDEGP